MAYVNVSVEVIFDHFDTGKQHTRHSNTYTPKTSTPFTPRHR